MDFKELYEKYNWGQVTKEEQEFVESELKRRKEAKENIHEGYESENKNSIEDDVVTINDSREEPESKKSNNENIDETTGEHKKINVPFVVLSCIMAAMIVTTIAVYVIKIDPMVKYVKKEKAQENYPYSKWNIDSKTLYSEKTDAQLGYETLFQFHNKGQYIPYFENLGEIDNKKGQYYYRITKNIQPYVGITLEKALTVEKPEFRSYLDDGEIMSINEDDEEDAEDYGNLKATLKKMKKNKIYNIFISLNKLIGDTQLKKLLEENYYQDNTCIKWVGVYPYEINDKYPPIGIYLGIDQSSMGSIKEMTLGYTNIYSVDGLTLKGNGYFYNGKNFFIYRSANGYVYDEGPELDVKTVKDSFSERLDFMIKHPEVLNFLGHPEYEEFYKKIKNMVDKGETKYYALALTGEKEDLEDMCSGLSGYVTSISDADEDEDLMYSLINSNIDPTHSIYSGTEYE